MKEERKGEGRPPAKALEVTSGPAFSNLKGPVILRLVAWPLGLLALMNFGFMSYAQPQVAQE